LLALAVTDTGTFGGSAELLLLVVSGSHVIPNAFLMVRCATTLEGATYITTHHTVATRSRCSGVLNNRNFIAHLLLGLGVKEFRKSVARVTVTAHIHNHQRVQFFGDTLYGLLEYVHPTGYWLRFLHPTRHKIGHFGDVPQANLLAWYGKTKTNNKSTHSSIKRNVQQQNKHKKLKPGLVASYDIRPGNGIPAQGHKFVTYLLRHLPTYSSRPTWGMSIMNANNS